MTERIHHITPSSRKTELPTGGNFDDTLAMLARRMSEQTVRLDLNTQELLKHQDTLAEQQAGLEHLVNDYYQLREQSQEGHRRVVALNKDLQSLREVIARQIEEAMAASAESTTARLARSDEETAALKTLMTEQKEAVSGQISGLSEQITGCIEQLVALSERNDGVMAELNNTRRSLARYVDTKFAQQESDQQKTATEAAEATRAIDREINDRKAELEKLEAALTMQRTLFETQSRDLENRLDQLSDELSTKTEEGQSRLKIVHVALAGLGVAVIGLLALVLVTM
ncbi:MAG: hypothetical protein RLZZ592_879 [Pseudomonadota bacterium]